MKRSADSRRLFEARLITLRGLDFCSLTSPVISKYFSCISDPEGPDLDLHLREVEGSERLESTEYVGCPEGSNGVSASVCC